MSRYIEERVIEEALYLTKNNSTVRNIAKNFKVSKSTVHKDLRERLKKINSNLYEDVTKVFNKNINERHIRGGEATKNKYLSLR